MADTEYKRLIQSAQDKAMFGFLAVMQRAMQDADRHIVELLSGAKSGVDHSMLTSVRHFLRQDGNMFLRRIDALFRSALDRAMQTMYVDLRPGMRKVSASELSLIDDEVVNHQIEVGRLTERMREDNEEVIGRLNVIVAQLHGEREARERENPFRPYLLARALYDAVKEVANDEPKVKVLYEHLSHALIKHLPGYYAAIRDVFEASGVRGRFVAQRSRAAHTQRLQTGQQGAAADIHARVLPGLQRILEMLQKNAGPGASAGDPGHGQANGAGSLEAFIRKMFAPDSFILSPDGEFVRTRLPSARAREADAAPVNPLVAQLGRYQKASAERRLTPEQIRLTALRDHLELATASTSERMTVDVVAMLFEFILDDEQIPAHLRQDIGRLQVPILKAALLEPELLHNERHAARKLLNRLSSAAAGMDAATPAGQELANEITRTVDKVLAEFSTDTATFANSLLEFEDYLAGSLRQDDRPNAQAIDAVETAERFSVLLTNVTTTLCDILLPLNSDKRLSDFVIHVWPHVLVQAASHDAEKGIAADSPDSLLRQYHAALPELLWSVQEKADAHERTALMRLLPGLVKRLREAIALIQLPEDDATQILDQLVDMHTQILRNTPKPGSRKLPSLDELRAQFHRLTVNWERAAWSLPEPPQPRPAVIEEVFERRGVEAEQNLGVHTVASTLADREFLSQTYLLGTRVAFAGKSGDGEGGGNATGQLVWVSTHRSLYLFRRDGDGKLLLYSFASLLEALRDEAIVPVEYAPVFERAVESLLFGAGSIQAATA